jgi:hypothetical protein
MLEQPSVSVDTGENLFLTDLNSVMGSVDLSPRNSIYGIDRQQGDFIECNKQMASVYKGYNHERRS